MVPAWNTKAFGCLVRDEAAVRSLLRTQLSSSLPAPFVSRSADQAAPLALTYSIDLSKAEFATWQQWYTYDLNDGALPFTMYLPWGTQQPRVRCRLVNEWQARRVLGDRWQVSGEMELERESLPRFSGGAQ